MKLSPVTLLCRILPDSDPERNSKLEDYQDMFFRMQEMLKSNI